MPREHGSMSSSRTARAQSCLHRSHLQLNAAVCGSSNSSGLAGQMQSFCIRGQAAASTRARGESTASRVDSPDGRRGIDFVRNLPVARSPYSISFPASHAEVWTASSLPRPDISWGAAGQRASSVTLPHEGLPQHTGGGVPAFPEPWPHLLQRAPHLCTGGWGLVRRYLSEPRGNGRYSGSPDYYTH